RGAAIMSFNYRLAVVPALAVLVAVSAAAAPHHHPAKPGKARLAQAATPAATAADASGLLPPPPNTPSLSLMEALAVAYETHPTLSPQQASLRATDEGVAIANGGWRPTISAGGTYAYQQYYFFPQTVTDANGNVIFGPFSTISAHPLQGALTI